MTRMWIIGEPILVETAADGSPVTLTWNGTVHPIHGISDRWRVDADWWRGRIWRMYFTVTTRTGLLLDVYHDLAREGWYVQRLYD